MLSTSFQVSIISLFIISIVVYLLRKIILTGWVYILLVYMMFVPGVLFPIKEYLGFANNVSVLNLIILIILLFLGFVPWVIFDIWLKRKRFFLITRNGISILNIVIIVTIISSFISIVYVLPYSISSIMLGAGEIRDLIADEYVLPPTVFTTFSVAVSACFPLVILLFYLSFIDSRLKKYRFLLLISSFSYVISSMAFAARDGLIILPLLYIVFFIVFRKSMMFKDVMQLNRVLRSILFVTLLLISIYSVDRFYKANSNSVNKTQNLINGTFGYLYQQPYVFDRTLQYQDNFHGLDLRFPIVNRILQKKSKKVLRVHNFETMFGTMYAEFYSVNGFYSLFLISILFCLYYSLALYFMIKKNRVTGVLLIFTVYLYIVISGLFYFRIGTLSLNYLYAILSVLPFFLNNIVKKTRVKLKNKL